MMTSYLSKGNWVFGEGANELGVRGIALGQGNWGGRVRGDGVGERERERERERESSIVWKLAYGKG